ncbi:MAG: hypothetical protein ETSY2_45510 [Candidatus Entotheonella gemina]|uniref:Uncharacterized protein n=2 Tax=Candidatus Entotheonella TaxID=93171 RepID=W4LFR6_9BACT|nr:MAG: hypothetical protein ETSY2_45510 [Candidatus Entotheonella gemina]
MHPGFKPSLIILLVVFMGSCATGRYVPVDNVAKLDVAFTDAGWTGGAVPNAGVCARYGGESMSPPLAVRNIPSGTTDIIIEFNDLSYPPLSSGGGHGAIRVPAAGKTEVMIPAVPGETFDLPQGVFMEAAHRGTVGGAGAYLGPCSGGRGNIYEADVKAVSKSTTSSQPSRLLGKGSITLGRY